MGRREDFSVREVCRKDMALLEKGKGTLTACKDLMAGSCLFIYLFLNTFIEQLPYARLLPRPWDDTSVNQTGKAHSAGGTQ